MRRSPGAKRCLDVVVSGVGLVLLSPVLVVVAIAVRVSSPGPVIFAQQRVGRDGRPFTLHKFRTLRNDPGGPLITAVNDRRITGIGAVLRQTKLDELPQLVDVLRGEMSLVGPRPEVARYVAMWPESDRTQILSVRPGITDPVTVLLRHESEQLAAVPDPERYYVEVLLPQKVAAYVEYVRTRSFSGDLVILLDTARAVTARPRRGS